MTGAIIQGMPQRERLYQAPRLRAVSQEAEAGANIAHNHPTTFIYFLPDISPFHISVHTDSLILKLLGSNYAVLLADSAPQPSSSPCLI